MENYVLENGITLRNALKLEIEKEVYYITKAAKGYTVYNSTGAGISVPDIENVEKQSSCSIGKDTFTIGCVTVPKHWLEIGKKAFSEKAGELEKKIAEKKQSIVITKKDK